MSYPQGCSDRGLGPGKKAIGNGGALNKQVPRGGLRSWGTSIGFRTTTTVPDLCRGPHSFLAQKFPTPPASAGVIFDGDEGRLSEEAFLSDFAGDLPEAKAKVLYAVQWPFHKALLAGKTTHAAWRSKPSYYAVSTEDRTINPDLERFMAKRMGAKTIEVKSSHLSLISHPDEITQLILEATGEPA
jgi:pimeloyl-ACP methyl ester carboxylesterase